MYARAKTKDPTSSKGCGNLVWNSENAYIISVSQDYVGALQVTFWQVSLAAVLKTVTIMMQESCPTCLSHHTDSDQESKLVFGNCSHKRRLESHFLWRFFRTASWCFPFVRNNLGRLVKALVGFPFGLIGAAINNAKNRLNSHLWDRSFNRKSLPAPSICIWHHRVKGERRWMQTSFWALFVFMTNSDWISCPFLLNILIIYPLQYSD